MDEYRAYDFCITLTISDSFFFNLYLVFIPLLEFLILVLVIWTAGLVRQRQEDVVYVFEPLEPITAPCIPLSDV